MKLFLLTLVNVLVCIGAEPSSLYGYDQYSWPSAYGPGFSSTCYGCRPFGHLYKRSAEAEPSFAYGPGIAQHPFGATSYVGRTIWGFPHALHKRSAQPEPSFGYGPGIAYHPYGGSSYVGRTIWGLGKRSAEQPEEETKSDAEHLQKRSAEAEPSFGYGPGIAYHPYGGSSYVGNSVWGLGHGYGYGYGY